MMTYRTPAKKNDKALLAKTVLLLILVLVVIVFFSFFSPIFKKLSTLWPISNLSSWMVTKSTLIKENEALRQKVAELEGVGALALSKDIEVSENMLSARVLKRPGNSPYDTILVDLGKDQGITLGQKVYVSDLLVGSVTGLFDSESIVTLYSAPGTQFTVLVGQEKHEAEAKGLGGGVMELLVPKGDKVAKGDKILSPENGVHFFGRVESVEVLPEDAFQRVLFRTPFNIYTLETVFLNRN